jgi:hypothetical protein
MIRVSEKPAASISRVEKIFNGGNNLPDHTAQLPTTSVIFDTLLQHNISIKNYIFVAFSMSNNMIKNIWHNYVVLNAHNQECQMWQRFCISSSSICHNKKRGFKCCGMMREQVLLHKTKDNKLG